MVEGTYGLGVNRIAHILGEAFPEGELAWDRPDALRAALWTGETALPILAALEAEMARLPGLVTGQRKSFTAWSRKVQFAAAKPGKAGIVLLGLAVLETDPRFVPSRNDSWSERLKAKVILTSAADIDDALATALRTAWERS